MELGRENLSALRDPKLTPADYIVENVEPRRGMPLRDLHMDVMGSPCYIINAKSGERGLLMCLFSYDQERYHRLHTSTIEKVSESVGGEYVVIMTANTNYTLKRTNFSKSFRGVQKLGDDLAYLL